MRALAPLCALVTAGLALSPTGASHGGVYRGPASSFPPTAGPIGTPATPPPPVPGAPTTPQGQGGGSGAGQDATSWARWWRFNQDRYLNLKHAIWDTGTVTGSDGFFLGRGQRPVAPVTLRPTEEDLQTRVVPQLLRLLRNERSNDIATAAMVALAKVGSGADGVSGPRIEAALRARLADKNQEIAETAAVALGILGHESSAFLLADLLGNTASGQELVGSREVDYRTRAFAAYGLGLIAGASEREDVRRFVVQKLVRAYEKNDTASEDVPVAAVIALGLVPLAIADEPRAAAPSPAPPAPTSSRQGQVLYLLDLFADDDADPLVRGHVPVSLARLMPGLSESWRERVVRSLVQALGPHNREWDEVEEGAVQALGLLVDGDAEPTDVLGRETLFRLTADGSEEVRRFALIALSRCAARPGNGDHEEALASVRAYLQKRLIRSPMIQRPWVGLALAELERNVAARGVAQSTASLEVLRKTLQRSISPEEVGGLAIAVGLARDGEAKGVLAQKLQKLRPDDVRGHLAVGLGLVGARESIEPLREIVRASRFRPGLLRQAAIGLGLLGDRDLVGELSSMLAEAKSLSSQAAIASALGFIGDRRAIDPLLAMATDAELVDGARAFAIVALGIVGDKEALPWNSRLAADLNYSAATSTLTDPTGRGILDIL